VALARAVAKVSGRFEYAVTGTGCNAREFDVDWRLRAHGDRLSQGGYDGPAQLGNDINGWHGSVHCTIGGTMCMLPVASAAPIVCRWHTLSTTSIGTGSAALFHVLMSPGARWRLRRGLRAQSLRWARRPTCPSARSQQAIVRLCTDSSHYFHHESDDHAGREQELIVCAYSRIGALAFLSCLFEVEEDFAGAGYKDRVVVFSSADTLRKPFSSSSAFILVVFTADAERELSGAHRRLIRSTCIRKMP
jgi:hypothetical protein